MRKKDGSSFIKVLVNSEQNPISIIKNKQWLKHKGKDYKFGFNCSEEFFEQLKKVEVEEPSKEKPMSISKDELKQMVKEILKEKSLKKSWKRKRRGIEKRIENSELKIKLLLIFGVVVWMK